VKQGEKLTRADIGLPVCDCPVGGPIGGWDEDGDSEGVADAESEAENDGEFEVGGVSSAH